MKRRVGDLLWKVGIRFVKWSGYLDPHDELFAAQLDAADYLDDEA